MAYPMPVDRRAHENDSLWAARGLVFCFLSPAEAQQPGRVPHIGYLSGASLSSNAVRIEALRQGLRDLGYTEGKSIVMEYRSADGKLDRFNELVAELVRLKVDVIVTPGPAPTRAAKAATA